MIYILAALLPPIMVSAASATSFSMVPSKMLITREATKAVTRLMASQAQRLRALGMKKSGAKKLGV